MASLTNLHIIHFNDVYHIQEGMVEPIGGAARFKTQVETLYKQLSCSSSEEDTDCIPPLVLFSGDAFNPSPQSTITRGWHMLPVLNHLKLDAACFGNHDFDFGVPELESLVKASSFPWILSNLAVDSDHPEVPLALGKRYHIINRGPFQIGIIGLVEEEWLLTIASLPSDYHYLDFIESAKTLSFELRKVHKVDVVIALTHMRLPNDELLAMACSEEIDLILGGHDHFYHVGSGCQFLDESGKVIPNISYSQDPTIPNLRVIKSDTDFRALSHIQFSPSDKLTTVQRYFVGSNVEPDLELAQTIAENERSANETLNEIVGYRAGAWDTRSEAVRQHETEIGNLVSDILLHAHPGSDVALVCGGTLRSETVYPPGPVLLKDLVAILPFDDPVVVLALKGRDLWDGLESSLSEYPKLEGRFPQLAGMRISFNPNAPPGKRLVEAKVRRISHLSLEKRDQASDRSDLIQSYEPIRLDHTYRVVTRNYMAKGFDGFSALTKGEYLVGEEDGSMAPTLVRRYFLGLKYAALMFGIVNGPSPARAALAAGRKWRCFAAASGKSRSFQRCCSPSPAPIQPGPASVATCLHASLLPPPPKNQNINNSSHPNSSESLDAYFPLHLQTYLTVDPKIEGRICEQRV